MGGGGGLTSALGPPVREWLVDVVGWRSIFFLNAPIAAVALVLAVKIRTRPTLTARCRPRSRWPGSDCDEALAALAGDFSAL